MLFIKTFIKWLDHEIGLDKMAQRFDLELRTSDLNLEIDDLD